MLNNKVGEVSFVYFIFYLSNGDCTMRTFSKLALTAGISLAISFTLSCSSDSDINDGGGNNNGNGGGLPSEYTGGSCNASDYGRVEIGGRVWMAKNWGCYAQGSKCYNNDPANCNTYGRLYDWATAMNIDKRYNNEFWGESDVNHRGICPSGWHIPSDAEWTALETAVGGSSTAGKYLKATSGWNSGGNGEDKYGFAALPGGSGNSDGNFYNVGNYGSWWSATEYYANYAYSRYMYYLNEYVYRYNYGKDNWRSVRCLQD